MLACASAALLQIWSEGAMLPKQIVPTLFIVGFASFLIWAPLVVYTFLEKFRS